MTHVSQLDSDNWIGPWDYEHEKILNYNSGRAWARPEYKRNMQQISLYLCTYVCVWVCMYVCMQQYVIHKFVVHVQYTDIIMILQRLN